MSRVLAFPVHRVRPAQPDAMKTPCCVIPLFPCAGPGLSAKKKKPAFAEGTSKRPATRRNRMIAKVKIAQKTLGVKDDDYRMLLHTNFGVKSCTELDEAGLVRLIAYFRSKGWQDRPQRSGSKDRHGRPGTLCSGSNPAAPVLQRIEALLSELGKVRGEYIPWDYAAAILKRIAGIDLLDAATVQEAKKVMVALENTLKSARRKPAQG